ncbi:MAG: VanZ family protein [Bacteroidales bacterium]
MLKPLRPALVWGGIVFILLSLPGAYIQKITPSWHIMIFDKLAHAGLFFVFSFLLMRGFYLQYKYTFLRLHYTIAGVIFGIVFGTFLELWQAFLNINRHADIYDFIANATGSFLAWPVFQKIKHHV